MTIPQLTLMAAFVVSACGSTEPPGGGPDQGNVPNDDGASNDGSAGSDGGRKGGDAPPAFGRIDPPGFVLDEGVLISGTITNGSGLEPVGTLRLEIALRPTEDAVAPSEAAPSEAAPSDGEPNVPEAAISKYVLLHVEDLEGLGPFQVRVPEDLGSVGLLAYFDEEMNGPSYEDMKSVPMDPVNVGLIDISGIELVIMAEDHVPGATPPTEPSGEPAVTVEEAPPTDEVTPAPEEAIVEPPASAPPAEATE